MWLRLMSLLHLIKLASDIFNYNRLPCLQSNWTQHNIGNHGCIRQMAMAGSCRMTSQRTRRQHAEHWCSDQDESESLNNDEWPSRTQKKSTQGPATQHKHCTWPRTDRQQRPHDAAAQDECLTTTTRWCMHQQQKTQKMVEMWMRLAYKDMQQLRWNQQHTTIAMTETADANDGLVQWNW